MATIRIQHLETGRVFEGPEGSSIPEGYARVDERPEPVYKNPPTTTDYLVAGLRQAAAEVLPMVGLVTGGALGMAGTGGNPLGGAGGAGLGYVTGRQANRLIGSLLNPTALGAELSGQRQGAPAMTVGQTAGAIGQDLMMGAAIDMASPMGVLLAQKGAWLLRAPLGIAGATAEDIAVRNAAARQDIPLLAGAASASRPVAQIESFPTRFPIGGQAAIPAERRFQRGAKAATEKVRGAFGPSTSLDRAGQSVQADVGTLAQQQMEGLSTLVDDVIGSFAPSAPTGKMALGESAKTAAKTVEKSRRDQASQVYESAIAGRGMDDVPLSNLQRVSTSMIQFENRLTGVQTKAAGPAGGLASATRPPDVSSMDLPPEAIRELLKTGGPEIRMAMQAGTPLSIQSLPMDFIERYGLATSGSRTLEETLAIQQRLGALARNTSDDVVRRQLRTLHDAVADDIQAFGVGTTLADAAKFYKDEVARYFGRKAGIRRLMDKTPGEVGDKVLSTTSPDLLTDLVKVLPKQQIGEVQRATLERMQERALSKVTGDIDPLKLEGEFAKFGDENIRILFGDGTKRIQQLRQTLRTSYGPAAIDKDLAKVLTANPEQVVNAMARGKIKSLDDFDAVWSRLSHKTRQEVRSALYDEVMTNAIDKNTKLFSTQRWITQKESVPQEIWDRMLTGNPAQALRDIERVFQRVNTFDRAVANPSGTAQGVFGPGQIMRGANLAFAGVQTGAATALGYQSQQGTAPSPLEIFGFFSPLALGLLIYSKGGQRALTSPVRMPLDLRGPGSMALRGAGVIANENRDPSLAPVQ